MSSAVDSGSVSVRVLRRSKGRVVKPGDTLAVRYEGELVADGSRFDANFNFDEFTPVPGRSAFTFPLGAGRVIQGWDTGLSGLRLGQVVELTIPSPLAYGSAGSPPSIPPNADLRFTVELLAALPKGAKRAVYPTLQELGLPPRLASQASKLGRSAQASKVGTDAGEALNGSSVPDLLIGLAGNDDFSGGAAPDVLIGGPGANRFRFSSLSDSPAAAGQQDTLLGFNARGGDRLDFSALADDLRFIGAARFSGVAGEVRFQSGRVQLDADGDAQADLELLLPGVKSLGAEALLS